MMLQAVEPRGIAIILGTGAEDLSKIGFDVKSSSVLEVNYSIRRQPIKGKAHIYDAVVGGVPIYLLSRHCSERGEYTPAYNIDHRCNIYALVKKCGARIILASSLVGGCRTTDWKVGDMVAVRDGINEHPDTHYVDGIQHYIHAHNLFDPKVTDMILSASKELGVDVHDGGVYYSSPLTTGAKFESPAEMQHLLAPAYQQKQIDALYNAFNTLLAFSEIRNHNVEKFLETFRKNRRQIKDSLFPNLVGMSLVRESDWTRTLSEGKTRYAGIAVVSDFPEDEETAHTKNVDISLAKLPEILRIYAEIVPRLNRIISDENI